MVKILWGLLVLAGARVALLLLVALVDQRVPVTSLASLHVLHSLVGLAHGPGLDPGLHVLVDSKLQHLLDLMWRSNLATADLGTLADESEAVEARDGVLGCADLDECAEVLQKREVVHDGQLRRGDCADDKVERVRVLVGPVLSIVSFASPLKQMRLTHLVFLGCNELGST